MSDDQAGNDKRNCHLPVLSRDELGEMAGSHFFVPVFQRTENAFI